MRSPMRQLAAALLVAAPLLLSSCKTDREEELESTVSYLQAKLDEVRSHLSDAENAISELRSDVDTLNAAVDDFGQDGWRQVVHEVRDAAASIESSLDDAETAIADAVSAAD